MKHTRRQKIVERLRSEEWAFDDLRHDLGLTVKVLEEDLKHIQKSVRTAGDRLLVRSAMMCGVRVRVHIQRAAPTRPLPKLPRPPNLPGPWFRVAILTEVPGNSRFAATRRAWQVGLNRVRIENGECQAFILRHPPHLQVPCRSYLVDPPHRGVVGCGA